MAKSKPFDLTLKEIERAFSDERWGAAFPPILTIEEAAALARVPKGTLYSWSSQGMLGSCSQRAGKHLRIWRDRFIQAMFNGEFVSGN